MNSITMLQLLVFFLILFGGVALAAIRPKLPKVSKASLERMTDGGKKSKRKESAKEYVDRINGKARESIFTRSKREARQVYNQTGQIHAYRKTLTLSWTVAVCGAVIGLVMQNVFLAVVLAAGGYFLPLWWSQFALFRYHRYMNEELEIALSLITTSYTRTNDLLSAVEENLGNFNSPVKDTFASFVNNLKYVDPNAPAQIERMKETLDSKLFHQWCDALILCQNDNTLRSSLPPIVSKFSDQKTQQLENETLMMLPIRRAVTMIILTLSFIPIFKIANNDWYLNLTRTIFGQISLVATAVVTLITINKAIRLSKPIEYDV